MFKKIEIKRGLKEIDTLLNYLKDKEASWEAIQKRYVLGKLW
jgi:hypothetical protein